MTEWKYTVLSTAVSTNDSNLLLTQFEIYSNLLFNVNVSHNNDSVVNVINVCMFR